MLRTVFRVMISAGIFVILFGIMRYYVDDYNIEKMLTQVIIGIVLSILGWIGTIIIK